METTPQTIPFFASKPNEKFAIERPYCSNLGNLNIRTPHIQLRFSRKYLRNSRLQNVYTTKVFESALTDLRKEILAVNGCSLFSHRSNKKREE